MQCGLFFVKVDEVARRLSVTSNILACVHMEMEFPCGYINSFVPYFLTSKGIHTYNGNMGNLFSRRDTFNICDDIETTACQFCEPRMWALSHAHSVTMSHLNYMVARYHLFDETFHACNDCFFFFRNYRYMMDVNMDVTMQAGVREIEDSIYDAYNEIGITDDVIAVQIWCEIMSVVRTKSQCVNIIPLHQRIFYFNSQRDRLASVSFRRSGILPDDVCDIVHSFMSGWMCTNKGMHIINGNIDSYEDERCQMMRNDKPCKVCSWDTIPRPCISEEDHNAKFLEIVAYVRKHRKMNDTCVICNFKGYKLCNRCYVTELNLFDNFRMQSGVSNFDLPGFDFTDDWSIKLFEDLIILLTDLYSAKSYSEYLKAVIVFSKLRISTSLINSEFSHLLVEKFKEIVEYKQQGFIDILDSGDSILNKFEEIRHAPLFSKLYRFAMFAMSISLFDKVGITFDKLGYSFMEKTAVKRKFHMGPDLISCFIDTLLFLCRKGYQVYVSRSFDPLYHSGSEYEKFYETMMRLKQQAPLMDDPETHGLHEATFLKELEEAIEKGESMYKHATRMTTNERKRIFEALHTLKGISMDLLTARFASSSRKAPFVSVIHGEPGIGKSTITNLMFIYYGQKMGLDTSSSSCYVRNSASDFWDMFRPSMWCCVLDDVAAKHPNKTPTGDESSKEVIQAANSVGFTPAQASLEKKGKNPFRCALLLMTANVKTMNAQFNFSTPSAFLRRGQYYIDAKVRPEYRNSDGRLDSRKVDCNDPYPDLWLFTIEEPVLASGRDMPKFRVIHENIGLKEFLQWYSGAIDQHVTNQNKVMDSIEKMRGAKLCSSCSLPDYLCECEEITAQSGNDLNYSLFTLILFLLLGIVTFEFFARFAKLKMMYYFHRRFSGFISSYYRIRNYFCYRLSDKEVWYQMGEKIRKSYKPPTYLVKLGALLASGGICYKVLRYLFRPRQGGVVPVPDSERKNPWYNVDNNIAQFDVDVKVSCLKGQVNTLISKMSNNVMFIDFVKGSKSFFSRTVCLKGQIYLTCNHCVPEDFDYVRVISANSQSGVNTNRQFTLEKSQIYRDKSNDLCLLHLTKMTPRTDITPYFVKASMNVRANGLYLKRQEDGSIIQNAVTAAGRNWGFVPEFLIAARTWSGTPQMQTIDGDCGMPLILDTAKGPVIVGVHSAARTNEVYATEVSFEWIEEHISHFNSFTLQASQPILSAPSVARSITKLHHKSVFRYIEEGDASVYGSFTGFRQQPKSMVENTIMSDYLALVGYKIKYTRPPLNWWMGKRIGALDLTNPVSEMKQDILSKCADEYLNDIIEHLPTEEWNKIEVYDDFTTINGAAGVSYVDAINRGTSAGAPWAKKKSFLNHAVPPRGQILDPVMPNQEVMERVRFIEERYRNNERYHPVFTAHYKDEPISFAKAEIGKVRVFCGAPYDWTIVVRKYLLSFIRVVQRNRYVFESAPGTIAQSKEWHNMHEYLTEHGSDRIVAGDYKAFDKRMPAQLMLTAYDVIYRICEKAGYSPEELQMIRGIATDTSFPLTDFFGDLVEFVGSNPSGHPLTVIINGICNSLYMRYCYYELNPEKECSTFKSNVNLMTYGDDNIMGVSRKINFFNHTAVADCLSKIDVTYTMADKAAESVPFIHIDKATFLKRYWRFDKDLGYYVCPLEHDSIEKSLMTWTRSKTIVKEEQAIAVITSAVREYFFYGKKIFNDRRDILMKMANDLGLQPWILESTFPTWDSLAKTWLEVSRGL